MDQAGLNGPVSGWTGTDTIGPRIASWEGMEAVGLVQRFERRLEGIVGNSFARVFGGSVVPQEVAQALQREGESNVRELAGGRLLAPNHYTVLLGPTDHDRLAGAEQDEQRITTLFADCVAEHLTEHGWETYGDVVVSLERSDALHTGQFRTRSSVDPDARRRSARPRNAGDRSMSQPPGYGQHPEGDPYGQHGYGQGQYGADPNYGQGQYGGGYDQGGGYPQQGGGYDQGYGQYGGDPNYGGQQQGGYPQQGGGYDQGYGQQGGYGGDPNYGGQQYGGGGYDQGYGQQGGGYGAPGGGYPPQGGGYPQQGGYGEPQQGYAPPAVQTGPRQLTASLSLDDGSNRNYQLKQGGNVVGRGQDADFRLPDTGVSRRHLEITWDGQSAMLADLGSTNGTTVNNNPVQTWQLADGDVIRIGHSSLVFRSQG